MIVPVTSEKYSNLFAEASDFLISKGKMNEGEVIDNLNEYYAHMNDFLTEKGNRFVMMPLDGAGEDPFTINLNTRTVTVPATFAKVGAVQADQLAELIIFEADRFFDYMDLANTYIYVQWELPDQDRTKGATPISIIDLEGKEGKIRFAWPLNDTITAQNGIVKFSVRFYVMDEDQDVLKYSLNTLEANLAVKPALDPTGKPNHIESKINELFESAVINSAYAGTGVTPPVNPHFASPGSDMTIVNPADYVRNLSEKNEIKTTQVAKLGSDNELKLKVQAVAADAGTITYQWKFKADTENAEWVNATIGTASEGLEEAILPKDAAGKPYLSYVDRYYKEDGSRYVGTAVPNEQLYEKYQYYTIKGAAGKNVVGTYAAVAKNTLTADKTTLESNAVWSTYCYLPGPKDIAFAEKTYTITTPEEGNAFITAHLKEDINQPSLEYIWYRSDDNEAAAVKAAKDKTASAVFDMGNTALIPGWYATRVNANLNLKDKTEYSRTAQIIYAEPAIAEVDPAGEVSFEKDPGQIATLTITPKVNVPTTLANDASEVLYKQLSYKWLYKAPNTNSWKEITENMISETDDSKLVYKIESTNQKSTLYARNIDDMNPYQYRCVVTNTLGDKSISMEQSIKRAFLVY